MAHYGDLLANNIESAETNRIDQPGWSAGGWTMLNAAPCGSLATAIRPTGVSKGAASTVPPSSVTRPAVASASVTAKYTCQWFGTPAICGGMVLRSEERRVGKECR